MKAVDGALRLDQDYKLINCTYAGKYADAISSGTACDNCGKLITNIAVVKGSKDNREYHIGLDCAETLTTILASDIAQAKKELRQTAKFLKYLNTECKSIVISDSPNAYTGWAYNYLATDWDSFWKFRFNYLKHKELITKLGIPVIVYHEMTVEEREVWQKNWSIKYEQERAEKKAGLLVA